MRLCRDEDCPTCGWPETYSEVPDTGDLILVAVGCSKCGWRVETGTAKPK